jgi:hypothetical protein
MVGAVGCADKVNCKGIVRPECEFMTALPLGCVGAPGVGYGFAIYAEYLGMMRFWFSLRPSATVNTWGTRPSNVTEKL